MNDRDKDTLARLVKDAHGRIHRCVVYGATTTGFGVFFPDPEWNVALGAPSGKTRHVIYGLCESHSTLPYDVLAAAIVKALEN